MEWTNPRLRAALAVLALAQLAVAAALFWQLPVALDLWPFPGTSPLSAILLASLIAAAAASIGWAVWAGRERALAGIGLDYVATFTFMVLIGGVRVAGGDAALLPFGLASIVGLATGIAIYLRARRAPWVDDRPMPRVVRISFGIFVAALGPGSARDAAARHRPGLHTRDGDLPRGHPLQRSAGRLVPVPGPVVEARRQTIGDPFSRPMLCATRPPAAVQGDPCMSDPAPRSPRLPPRWFVRIAWVVHRVILRVTGGRRGLWAPTPGKWGAMRLTTVGRRSGRERTAILGYFEDGPNLVTMAMNGWAVPEPAWWLNLQARPEATVMLKTGARRVRAHAATGEERTRLWDLWRGSAQGLDGYASRRPGETAVVVLEPIE